MMSTDTSLHVTYHLIAIIVPFVSAKRGRTLIEVSVGAEASEFYRGFLGRFRNFRAGIDTDCGIRRHHRRQTHNGPTLKRER